MARGFLAALTRRRLIGSAGAAALLPAVPRVSPATALPVAPSTDPQSLRTTLVLEIRATTGPAVEMGAGASGSRRLVPLTGGTFEGPELRGVLEPGSIEFHHERGDGVVAVETQCRLRCEDGTPLAFSERGLQLPANEEAPTVSARTVPEFAAGPGRYEWLNTAVFVGALDASAVGEGRVVMRVYRVL